MLQSRAHVTLWRLVIEAASPWSIGSGFGDSVRDMQLARDANGLPFLPASSLAGVLRAECRLRPDGETRADQMFGFAKGEDGLLSRVWVGHGHIHDSHDKPVRGLYSRESKDPLLAPLQGRSQTLRSRVRLDHRGTADDGGLFERAVLPAGHRFSLEVLLSSEAEGEHEEDSSWMESVLAAGVLRVGGATRSGHGLLRVVRGHRRRFHLKSPVDLAAWSVAVAGGPDSVSSLEVWDLQTAAAVARGPVVEIALTPVGGFRFGGGTASLAEPAPTKLAHDLPVSEQHVEWSRQGTVTTGRLSVVRRPLIPATGVKGPLAHRTAFHANRLAQCWAEDLWAQQQGAQRPNPAAASSKSLRYDKTDDNSTVRKLFGWVPSSRADAAQAAINTGRAGVLTWTDAVLERASVKANAQMHNSIDRFTGGVRDGALYTVENLHAASVDPKTPWVTLRVSVNSALANHAEATRDDWKAFEMALDDLVQGRLALGADGASGQGFFRGTWRWVEGKKPYAEALQEVGA